MRLYDHFYSRVVLVFVVILITSCGSHQTVPSSPEKVPVGEIEFHPRQPERWTLSNGLTVLYLFDDEIPMVRGTLLVRGGSLYAVEAPAGAISALGAQMREGSTKGISSDNLDKKLDDLGAAIESGFGGEYGSVSFSCLKEDAPKVFDLFSGIALQPTFDENRLALWKKLALEGIRRRRDSPITIAEITFSQAVYGIDNPYSRIPSAESISKINSSLLRQLHSKFLSPKGAYLIITGSIAREDAEKLIVKHFGDWKPTTEPLPALPEVTPGLKPGIYVLERDFDQATVFLGHVGPPRLTDDMYAMVVFNQYFGHGGFETKLFNEVRSRLGLAYDISGGLFAGEKKGVFQVALQTRAEEAVRAINRVLEIIKDSHVETPPSSAIANAKSSVQRSFVFKFTSTGQIAQRPALLELQNYPEDYDDKYVERIGDVTPEAAREVAVRWISPENLVVVVVGRVDTNKIKEGIAGDLPVMSFDFDTKPIFTSR